MKKSLYWKLLSVILIVFCFFGCGESDQDNSSSDSGSHIISVPSRTPSIPENEDEEPPDIEVILEEIEKILVELEELLAENNENIPEDKPVVQDFDPPKMTETSIVPGAQDVNLARVIKITFDEPIDTADVTLQIKGGDIVETRVVFRNETIEVKRLGRGKDFHLKPLTTYVIKGIVSDVAGNETEVEMTFTTGEVILDDGF